MTGMKYGITCGVCNRRDIIDTSTGTILYFMANSGWKSVGKDGEYKHLCPDCYIVYLSLDETRIN